MILFRQQNNSCWYKFIYIDIEKASIRTVSINPNRKFGSLPEPCFPDNPHEEIKRALIVTPKTAGKLLKAEDIMDTKINPRQIGLEVSSEDVIHPDGMYHYRIHGKLDNYQVLMDWFNPITFAPGDYDFNLRAKPQDWSGFFGVGLHRD